MERARTRKNNTIREENIRAVGRCGYSNRCATNRDHIMRWRLQCGTPVMGRMSFSRMGQSEVKPNRARCCSQSMGKVRVSLASDKPVGSSPLRIASVISGARVVNFRMRTT